MLVKRLEELEAWKIAHEFTLAVYRASQKFPREETFGISSQLRRSAASVAANVAEGFGRGSAKEFRRSVRISSGSLEEARYFLLLARELEYLGTADYKDLTKLADRVGSLLGGLHRHLSAKVEGSS